MYRVDRKRLIYLFAILVWVVSVCIALSLGSVSQISSDAWVQFRLPRVFLASWIGAGLAIAGAILQALFSNPLCEPYTLGISSGAALGAVLGISMGLDLTWAGLTGTAFVGAMLFALLLYGVTVYFQGKSMSLLLVGVMLGFLGTSLVALWITVQDNNGLQSSMGWLFGDLSRARLSGAVFSFIFLLILGGWSWTKHRELDALLLGEEDAMAMGVDVPRIRKQFVWVTSFLVGLCVSAGGMIGFVGLVVPHLVRRSVGSLHFHLLPLCAIWGEVLLTLADCAARTFVRPMELPVGILTAWVGAPLFLWILSSRKVTV